MGSPRLLFLGQTLPYPPDSGVTMRSFHVLRQLCRRFDVTALCFYRRDLVGDRLDASVESLREWADVTAFPIPEEHSRARRVWNHVRSVAKRRVYTRYVYESADYRRAVRREIARGGHDLVHADSMDLSAYFDLLDDRPLVCVHHNVESQLLDRRARAEPPPARWYVRHQASLMEREERTWCPRVDLNVTVSEDDRRRLREQVGAGEYAVVPNGVDVEYFQPADAPPVADVSSIGGVEWFPNRDALDFFCADVLPELRRRAPSASVRWVGRCPEELRERYGREHDIELTGYVDDVRPHLAGSRCFVVPLRVGGGTRLKILTAWAMGVPVVSTSVGCEGLEAVDGENILVRDDPAAFADAVASLLADDAMADELGRGGRRTAEEVYSWRRIGDDMLPRYLELLA